MMGRTRRSCADWCGSMAAWLPTSIYFPVSASQLPAQGSVQPGIFRVRFEGGWRIAARPS